MISGLIALAGLTIAGALAASANGARHPVTSASLLVAMIIVLGGPQLLAAVRRKSRPQFQVMPAARFDELIHPSRGCRSSLAAADWAEFAFLRDELELSDFALSKQLSTLEEAGYVHIDRPPRDHRRHVGARLTPAGRSAFHGHVAALREIVAAADPEQALA